MLDQADLEDFGARWLASGIGRFTEPDPVELGIHGPQNLNRYVYVRNNPLSDFDPNGAWGMQDVADWCSGAYDDMSHANPNYHQDTPAASSQTGDDANQSASSSGSTDDSDAAKKKELAKRVEDEVKDQVRDKAVEKVLTEVGKTLRTTKVIHELGAQGMHLMELGKAAGTAAKVLGSTAVATAGYWAIESNLNKGYQVQYGPGADRPPDGLRAVSP